MTRINLNDGTPERPLSTEERQHEIIRELVEDRDKLRARLRASEAELAQSRENEATEARRVDELLQERTRARNETLAALERLEASEAEVARLTVRANHLPGLSAAYSETRDALAEATRALRVIDGSRGEPVTELQRAAVAELRRLIGVCELALGHGDFRPVEYLEKEHADD